MELLSGFISNESVTYLTPTKEELLPNYKLKCEIISCNSIFTNAGNLQLHLKKHHSIKLTKDDKKIKTLYCCPEEKCTYNRQSTTEKSFASLKYLKQHYQKVHADKNFKCTDCPKAFAAQWMLISHKSECGKKYICQVCNVTYNSSEALLTHAKRKGHRIKSKDDAKMNKIEIPRLETIYRQNVETLPPIMYVVQFPDNITSDKEATTTEQNESEQYLTNSPELNSNEIKNGTEHITENINQIEIDEKTTNFDELCLSESEIQIDNNGSFDQLVSNSLCDIETQTEFDETSAILDVMLYSNNYTQTCDDFLSELGLADIQTQTNWSTFSDSSTSPGLHDDFLVSTETQTTQCLFESCE